ncbi:unnamed protein product [Chrysodeixis includens]|uniref:Prohormone-3 n=1 Tax=Chrysodeixis includens TaxID=689277 RepID=A0A9N8Q2I5_CHRIL|nr:unnamed protein product [Chrysodeixis includens]
MSKIALLFVCVAAVVVTSTSASSTNVQLPAVYPLVNILLPLLNNVYNLLLSLLSIFDTLPANISCMIPVDLGALETSLLKLYSQALAIVNFLRGLPEYAVGASPNTPPDNVVTLQGLITTLITAITDLTDDVLVGIGGGLLPGLLKLVVMVVEALLSLLFTTMAVTAVLVLSAAGAAHAWGGLFNRFSSDMLANLGYGRSPYRHYPYGQDPEEVYAEALEGNRIDDVMEEPAHCYSSPCTTNGDCCRGLLCLDTEDGGRCLPAFAGRKLGEICNRENQCDAGLVCEEVVPGEMHVCRPPTAGRKQYNEDCSSSGECDVTRGLCCIMQRRHRQKPRKSCGYFKEPLVCIGPVATDQIHEFVQHTAGEKRIGAYRLH